ncbi:hypothetical protein GO604_01865 [Aeromonas hydrophila subsp. ranae]|nr:hypothetical protein [Aeromonas hydrophila subsp. ranae]
MIRPFSSFSRTPDDVGGLLLGFSLPHSAPALTPGSGAGASSLFVILGEVAAIELA